MEIEYKFTVHEDMLPFLEDKNRIKIVQGYISLKPAVRVRESKIFLNMLNQVDKKQFADTEHWLTIKGDGLVSREEVEFLINTTHYDSLMAMCQHKVEKTRYIIYAENGLKWELDKFKGANEGLWLAEIEVPTEDTTFELPAWIKENVSLDKRYSNVNLATTPYKNW